MDKCIKAGKDYFISTEDELTGEDDPVSVDMFIIDISAKTDKDLVEVYENGIIRFWFGFSIPWYQFALFKHSYLPKGKTGIQMVLKINELSSVYERYSNAYIIIDPKESFSFSFISKSTIYLSGDIDIKITMKGYNGFEDDNTKYIRSILNVISGDQY